MSCNLVQRRNYKFLNMVWASAFAVGKRTVEMATLLVNQVCFEVHWWNEGWQWFRNMCLVMDSSESCWILWFMMFLDCFLWCLGRSSQFEIVPSRCLITLPHVSYCSVEIALSCDKPLFSKPLFSEALLGCNSHDALAQILGFNPHVPPINNFRIW